MLKKLKKFLRTIVVSKSNPTDIIRYNDAGQIIRHKFIWSGLGKVHVYKNTYDEQGRPLSSYSVDNGKISYICKHSYDGDICTTEEWHYDSYNEENPRALSFRCVTVYDDKADRYISQKTYKPDGTVEDSVFEYDDKNRIDYRTGATYGPGYKDRSMSVKDERGKTLFHMTATTEPNGTSRYTAMECLYDANGKEVFASFYSSSLDKFDYSRRYYDEKGRQTAYKTFDEDGMDYIAHTYYSDDETETTHLSNSRITGNRCSYDLKTKADKGYYVRKYDFPYFLRFLFRDL